MSQADWMDRLTESIREHETDRRKTFASLGRYRLMEEVGRGGMGVVYHAFDPQLGREVALKVLLDQGFASAEARERFVREAHVAARLNHPNIIPVFDTGEHEGRVFLAMQFIEGTPLDRTKLGPREAVSALRDVARAVHAAHQEGIIHRDLKPANLLVDRGGRVYVTDFGLARRVESGATLTLSGTVVGTPAYMPPEQACGKATDARSDVYALGATLYEVLTGKPPFSGGTPLETLKAVTMDEPVPPRRHDPQISKGLEAVILKAMDKKPEGRYATAAELADDLDRWLAGEEVRAPVRGTIYRARKKLSRHRWRVISAALAVALVGAGLGLLGLYVRAVNAYRAAMAEPDLLRKKPLLEFAARLVPEAQRELERVIRALTPPPLVELPTQDPRHERLLALVTRVNNLIRDHDVEGARREIRSLEQEGYGDTSSLWQQLRRVEFEDGLATLGELAASGKAADFGILFKKLRGPDYRQQPEADARLGGHALAMGLRLAAGPAASDAIRWLDTAESQGSGRIELFEARGLLRQEGGDWDGAERDYAEYNRRRPNGQPENPRYSRLLRHRAGEAEMRGAWKESLGHLQSAVGINPGDAQAFHDLGLARFRADRQIREALAELRTALRLNPALQPSREYADIALAAALQRSEAWRLDDADARQAAWKDAVEALDLALDRVAPGDPALLLERSRFRRRLGDLEGAVQDAASAGDRADAFLARGQAEFARDPASAAAAFEQAAVLDSRSGVARYWNGVCLQSLGRLDPAKDEFGEAISHAFDGPDLHARLAAIAFEQQAWPEVPGRTARVHETADAVSEDELLARGADARTVEIRRLRRDAHYLLARARFENREYQKAVDECTLALAQDPAHFEAHFRKGYALYHLKRPDGAIEAFSKAIDLKTGDAAPFVGRATVLAEKGLLDDALRDYDAAIRIEDRNYAALAGRGLAREAKGMIPDARDDLNKALRFAPNDWAHREKIRKKLGELK